MSGRNAKAKRLLPLLFLFLSVPAFARTQNFFTGSPFGFGFKGGLEKRPQLDFISDPQTVSAYSHFYSVEPFVDFGNFVLRARAALHYHPLFRAAGTDSAGRAFTETSDPGSFAYGLDLLLVPYYAKSGAARTYVVVGASQVSVNAKNIRSYTGGATNTEKVSGSGTEIVGGAGFEFFFVQNYSIQLEAGYRSLTVDSFTYSSESDTSGTAREKGEAVKNPTTGLAKKFHQNTPYITLGLNLNF